MIWYNHKKYIRSESMNAYQRISRYKSQLMGIAILIVVYGHFFYYHSGLKDYTQLNVTSGIQWGRWIFLCFSPALASTIL